LQSIVIGLQLIYEYNRF